MNIKKELEKFADELKKQLWTVSITEYQGDVALDFERDFFNGYITYEYQTDNFTFYIGEEEYNVVFAEETYYEVTVPYDEFHTELNKFRDVIKWLY